MSERGHVQLRDGSVVLVRPVRPEDRPLFVAGFERMSGESRYRRFMSHKKRLSERELDFFTRLDHHAHEAIGALDVASGEGAGVARMHRSEGDPSVAEAAVTVVDHWQGRGLGRVLLERLAVRARALGVERFEATLFTTNKSMLHLFQRLGCVRSHRQGLDVLEIDVALPLDDAESTLSAALQSAAESASSPSGS